MREFLAAMVTIATAFIGASIVYQVVSKPGGSTVVGDITQATTTLGADLFKGN